MADYPTGSTPDTEDFNKMAQGALDSATVASAASVAIDDNYFYTVTGTTQIDNFAPTPARVGNRIACLFEDNLNINPAGTGNIIFPGSHTTRGFQTIPGTVCEFWRVGTDWYLMSTNRSSLLPHWRMSMSFTQVVGDGNTPNINFDTVFSNYVGSFNTGNNRLTVPITGRYQIFCQHRVNGTAGGNFRTKIVNGVTVIAEERESFALNTLDSSVFRSHVALVKNDVIEIQSENQTGNSYTIQTGDNFTYWEMRMLDAPA